MNEPATVHRLIDSEMTEITEQLLGHQSAAGWLDRMSSRV